jgi:RNA polymerase sigma-70 factor (ECF subfamily)
MSNGNRTQNQTAAGKPPVADDSAMATSLLKRARTGDRGAFGQLVVLYQDRLYNAILRLVGDRDEAAELTQEAFARSLESLDSFRGDSAPYTWMFRIAVNLSISRLRKVQRHRVFSLDRPASGNGQSGRHGDQAAGLVDRVRQSGPGPAAALEKREQAEQVVAALGRVEPEYRAVLVMRDVEGFDYQQMADVLDLPLGTLKSRLFRARIALRDELKPYMEDETRRTKPRTAKE